MIDRTLSAPWNSWRSLSSAPTLWPPVRFWISLNLRSILARRLLQGYGKCTQHGRSSSAGIDRPGIAAQTISSWVSCLACAVPAMSLAHLQ